MLKHNELRLQRDKGACRFNRLERKKRVTRKPCVYTLQVDERATECVYSFKKSFDLHLRCCKIFLVYLCFDRESLRNLKLREMMKTFNLSTGGLDTMLDRPEEKGTLPNTSRYAWPNSDSGRASSSASSFPGRSSKNSYFARNSPHPNRVKHMKGLLDIPICTVTDMGGNRPDSRFAVGTPSSNTRRLEGILRLPVNAQNYRLKEKAIPTMGMGKFLVCFCSSDVQKG